MQNYIFNLFLTLFFVEVFTFSSFSQTQGNEKGENNHHIMVITPSEFDEQKIRAMALKDGIPIDAIDTYVAEEKRIFLEMKNNRPGTAEKKVPPIPFAACGDMGGENGWAGWKGRKGLSIDSASTGHIINTWQAWSSPPPATDQSYEFTINTGAGIDQCTPSAGNPAIPYVAQGFGNSSIQLGKQRLDWQASGRCVEQISFPFAVTSKDTNFVYAYAIVLDNPGTGDHIGRAAPFAEIYMLDANGDTVPCSHQFYHGTDDGTNPPGFFASICNSQLNPARAYKPWAIVGVNVNKYVGQTLNVVITNSDCAYGAHGCWSYWDFRCNSFDNPSGYFCPGTQISLTAPVDPQINYTYQWYQNGSPYTGTPNGTAQIITPYPHVGDTFYVDVKQPSKCNFKIVYVPQPFPITPSFNYAGACGKISFTDASTSVNGAGNITGWNWSFSGGTPSSSNTQNPGIITYSSIGTYSVTLAVTSSMGCIDSISLPVTITGLPQAAFSSTPVCEGDSIQFINNSIAASGDPIASYSWAFPGGNPSSSTNQNPSVIYPAGTYTVSLVVTSQGGCVSSTSQPITVHPFPVARFNTNVVCFNNPTAFTDLSSGMGSGSSWIWDFGDGNTSMVQNPTHTYGAVGTYTVSLIIINDFGCKDTNQNIVVVNPLPVADFYSAPVCLGNPTCFKDISVVKPGAIISWSWNFDDPGSGLANTSSLQNPCHTYNKTGPFNVILTATSDSGCQNTITLPVNTNPLPTAAIIPKNVCLNSNTVFIDGSSSPAGTGNAINAWDWNFGDGTVNSTLQNPSHFYVTIGTYTITLIVTTQNGCKDTATNVVTVYPPPIANYSDSVKGCAPQSYTFKDLSVVSSGTISTWQWSFPGGNPSSSSLSSPTVHWSNPGVYDAQLIVTTNYGCKDTLFTPMYINIYPWPSADFCVAPTTAPATDPKFNFCDMWSKDVTKWIWNFGDGSPIDSMDTDPAHSYSATVNNNDFYNYNICIRVENQHGCWDTTCKKVELIPEFEFYIPNTFTPNGDGTNELFYGKCRGVKEYNIWLFDRWGNQIWDCHHDDKNTNWDSEQTMPRQEGLSSYCKWDGIVVHGGLDMSGNSRLLAQEDVYVWKVNLLDVFDKHHTYIGHVNIVR